MQGSDPRAATCRGKLQSKRSKLNMEINKELRLRHGAENLYRATSDPKTKETVSLELRFVNSNLQLLKEQLAELNSSVEVYQVFSCMENHQILRKRKVSRSVLNWVRIFFLNTFLCSEPRPGWPGQPGESADDPPGSEGD